MPTSDPLAEAATAAPPALSSTVVPPSISIRAPSKYSSSSSSPASVPGPSPEFLHRTWSVTHSTLGMWRSAQNVRISYKPLPLTGDNAQPARNQDRVEYESNKPSTTPPKVKSVEGANTPASDAAIYPGSSWDWRGKGWLFFVTSHWEILGWGHRPIEDDQAGTKVERWAVTWFAPTLFTKEGIDVYCDRREGVSPATFAAIEAAANEAWPEPLKTLAKDLQPVDIKLPWQET